MFRGLVPREGKFFDLFSDSADLIFQGASEFRAMLDDMDHAEKRVRMIKDIEHRADETAHQTVELLHKTFITPLDRDDIHQLISKLDDIMDFIDGAAQKVHFYGITAASDESRCLADTCVQSAVCIRRIVHALNDLSNTNDIVKDCVEINRLENEADHILRSAVAKLFKEEQDVRQLIKLKEFYELLESVTDRCEDVANIVEGIVLEYA